MGYGEEREGGEGEEFWRERYPQPEQEWHGGFVEVPGVVIEGPDAHGTTGGTLGDSFDWMDSTARRRRRWRRSGSDEWGEDEQRLFEEIGADAFFGYATSEDEEEDEDEEFSETEDDGGDGAGMGEGVASMDYDALAAAAAAPLEFATRLDEEEAFLAGSRERRLAEFGQETPAARQELQALLSGRYVGGAPLNPTPAPSSKPHQHLDTLARTFSTDLNVAAAALLSQDPSSALSYTSFLRPGAFFVGEQSLGKKSQPFSSLREPALPWRNNGVNAPSTAHPAFAPFPSLGAGGGISDSLAIPRPSQSTTIEGPRNALTNFLRQSASSASASHPTPSSSSSSTNRFSPYAQSSTSTPTTATHLDASSNPHILSATRIRFGDTTNPAARSDRESWRAVEREMLSRARGALRETSSAAEVERKEGKGVKERWNVHVTIQSYEPMDKRITGFMRAFGIDGGAPVSATYSDVTTHFSGDILHPIIDGLFASPSLTGSGGPAGSVKVTRAFEAESWIQLGPFKGLSKGELLDRAKSRQWVEEQTKGWILFRWKEQGFVNVASIDSALSISGFYHVALNRRTGEIEGLYCDPAATPNQHLLLRPTSNASGAVSFGAFECR
ncbi:vacuolar import/degradation protein Vid24 [Rhodotorula toruloides]|uniref:Vacuolar import/degradation protein Vid24 n=1 Tax=Rhodotorula toruloides TaxID=5286 RepID=A0A511K8R0_RHOTO|nr:vacuolar import/degradation protein Vid24 [Rhodotorula toruloides]